jgi:hypothetical protein
MLSLFILGKMKREKIKNTIEIASNPVTVREGFNFYLMNISCRKIFLE